MRILKLNSLCFNLFLAVLLLPLSVNIPAAEKEPPPPSQVLFSSNGDVNNPVTGTTPFAQVEKSDKQKKLEAGLETARISGNTIAAKQIQAQLDALLGHVQIRQQDAGFSFTDMTENPVPVTETDYSQSFIHGFGIFSHAFGVAPAGSSIAGRLFYVLTQDAASGADSLKIMQSTDNGATWAAIHLVGINGYSINGDELDIEIVNDGTTTWIFGVVGFSDNITGRKASYFFRKNAITSGFYGTMLSFPGNTAGMHYYNPRITSDNSAYTSNTYVMILCSMDSLVSGNKFVKQKYVLCSTPFDAAPGLNYAQPNGTNGLGWMGNNGNQPASYLYGDIAYYKDAGGTGENRVIVVYGNYPANYNIFVTYLSGYTANPTNMILTDASEHKEVKIAFNGGNSSRNGMITYVRKYNATDWDVFAFKTTNGGSSSGSWIRDTIDYSEKFARSCDLAAVPGGNNLFKLTYAQDDPSEPAAFYRTFNGSWSDKFKFSNAKIDTFYAKPRAGYLLGGGDDGTGIWSAFNGYNGYFAKQIMTTTGITNNNMMPEGFSLSQNYPNPFNPVTSIRFSIPKAGLVTLNIYDITGKEVASLVNGNMNAGTFTAGFDASHLSSGAYFYRLSSNGLTEVKKMILIK